jgi:hypothetical protein
VLQKYGAVNSEHAVRIGIETGDIALSDMAVAYVVERNKMQNKFLGAIDEHVEQANKHVGSYKHELLATLSEAMEIAALDSREEQEKRMAAFLSDTDNGHAIGTVNFDEPKSVPYVISKID